MFRLKKLQIHENFPHRHMGGGAALFNKMMKRTLRTDVGGAHGSNKLLPTHKRSTMQLLLWSGVPSAPCLLVLNPSRYQIETLSGQREMIKSTFYTIRSRRQAWKWIRGENKDLLSSIISRNLRLITSNQLSLLMMREQPPGAESLSKHLHFNKRPEFNRSFRFSSRRRCTQSRSKRLIRAACGRSQLETIN